MCSNAEPEQHCNKRNTVPHLHPPLHCNKAPAQSKRKKGKKHSTAPERGLPRLLSGKEFTCQCRRRKRLGFNLWVRKIPWSKKWQPIPVHLPGEFHGQRIQAGSSPWGHQESDMTEHTHTHEKTQEHECLIVVLSTALEGVLSCKSAQTLFSWLFFCFMKVKSHCPWWSYWAWVHLYSSDSHI